MLGLAIHTSSPQLGLALQSIDATRTVNRHHVWDLGREVSSQLHVKLVEFMGSYTWQEVSFMAVAIGPGGFTGTRIGVVAARTLAQQLSIPLFGVSSLAAVAAQNTDCVTGQSVAVTMPAKREAVFSGIYCWDGASDLQPVRADEVVPASEWADILAQWPQPLKTVETTVGEGTATSVTGVMALAQARWAQGMRPEWNSVMPFYGQHPVHR